MEKNCNSYVCPSCFNQIKNCVCSSAPYFLIGVDELIQYAVKILNQKHYVTAQSCAGHLTMNENKEYVLNIYITFDGCINTNYITPPEGWTKTRSGIYLKTKNFKNKFAFLKAQKNEIIKLNNWVDELKPYNRRPN